MNRTNFSFRHVGIGLALCLAFAPFLRGAEVATDAKPAEPLPDVPVDGGEDPGEAAADANALFDFPESGDMPAPTPGMRALIEQMLADIPGEELPAPEGPVLQESSLDEAKLLELGKRVVGSVVVVQAYDEDGTRIGRAAGFFVDGAGMIATDPLVLGDADAMEPAYITVLTGDGRSHRVVGIAGIHGKMGSLFLQSDARDTRPLPVSAESVAEGGEDAAVLGFAEERGLILADAVARTSPPSGPGAPWLMVSGEHSAGITGSPVVDRRGRARGMIVLEFSLGKWNHYALPFDGFDAAVATARSAPLRTLSRAAEFRPSGQTGKDNKLFAAADALRENRPARAARILSAMADEEPRNASVWALYGLAARRLGAHAESAEAFRKAAALRPDAGSAWYNLALSELLRESGGKSGGAASAETLAALEKATGAGTDSKQAWLLLGQSALRAGDYPRAARAFIRVVELEDDYADGYYFLAVAQSKSGNLLAAQSALSRCLKLSPRHDRAWFLLGLVYTKAGNLGDAASAFEKCLEANRAHPQARRNLARVYLRMGRATEARAVHDEERKLR